MYAIVIIRYRAPIERIEEVTPSHRAYLATLHENGRLLASGPFDPRSGGALLLRFPDDDPTAPDRVRDGDPFWREGLVNYEILPWNPGIGRSGLDQLGPLAPG